MRTPLSSAAGRGEPTGRTMGDVREPAAPGDRPAEERPELFRAAVASLTAGPVRPEVRVEPLRPPQRLAPWSYAISADVLSPAGDELATGRLVLLHDPDGVEAWEGVLRLVAFASAELEPQMGTDELMPAVGWSWLVDALGRAARRLPRGRRHGHADHVHPLRRPGRARRPPSRWSCGRAGRPTRAELAPHLHAFVDMLCLAAGLPPEGVTLLAPTS